VKVVATPLAGLAVIEPVVHSDDRGRFFELFRAERYAAPLGGVTFVQDNLSTSRRGVVRGLHFQHPAAMGKLVTAIGGAIFDVAVDLRQGSATFGRWFGIELSAGAPRQLWIPGGFAHGFQALTDEAVVLYKCTAPFVASDDRAIHWQDPDIGIQWPLGATVISPRDAAAPLLKDLPREHLP
jgi:dTDP-4-dehydrorhamnose 3,5-epimerase